MTTLVWRVRMDRERLIEYWRRLPSNRQGLDNVLWNAIFSYPDVPVLHRFWDAGKPVDALQWYGDPPQMIGKPSVERQRAFPLIGPNFWMDWEAIHPSELSVVFVGQRRHVPASIPIEQVQHGIRFPVALCADCPLVVAQIIAPLSAGGVDLAGIFVPLPVVSLGESGILIRPREFSQQPVTS